jgi:hypothetical protein
MPYHLTKHQLLAAKNSSYLNVSCNVYLRGYSWRRGEALIAVFTSNEIPMVSGAKCRFNSSWLGSPHVALRLDKMRTAVESMGGRRRHDARADLSNG